MSVSGLKVLGGASSELLGATWEETEKELQEGWMEIDNTGGKNTSWAMRFGLQQRDKVRVIDDFSIAGVNGTTGLQERLKIFGIDDIAALIAYSLDTCGGEVHPTLLGKTMDLKSAYKQFGICSSDRERIRVATRHPTTSDLVLLMVNALPFGATGSVSGFLRVSMFLWFLGMMGARLHGRAFTTITLWSAGAIVQTMRSGQLLACSTCLVFYMQRKARKPQRLIEFLDPLVSFLTFLRLDANFLTQSHSFSKK